ncbi:Lead [Klebsiella michiganensis]|uniref:Lead n=1 Tax=Klebsiella michiganensis TaxID=1134687 RepID=A0A7H4PG70_9ENTR|nr:Lead [Klebsiella michiganensis]
MIKPAPLTIGQPRVTAVMTTADIGENDLLGAGGPPWSKAPSHPLAQAVVREAEQRQLVIPPASGQRALAGSGIEAQVEGRQVLICAAGKNRDPQYDEPIQQLESAGANRGAGDAR